MIDIVNEKLKEYGNMLEKNAKGEKNDLAVLSTQKDLLNYAKEQEDESLIKLMENLLGKDFLESKELINEYISSKEEKESSGMSNSQALSLGNPDVPKTYMHDSEDGGFTNIILLSVALIIVVAIILAIIFV